MSRRRTIRIVGSNNIVGNTDTTVCSSGIIDALTAQLAAKDSQIARLMQTISELMNMIK
jgi:hypothetical protein